MVFLIFNYNKKLLFIVVTMVMSSYQIVHMAVSSTFILFYKIIYM